MYTVSIFKPYPIHYYLFIICILYQLETTRLDVEKLNGRTTETQSNTSSEDDKELPASEKSLLQKIVRTGLITSKHDIEVQRRDPRSPLYSVKSFELLKL